MRVMEEDKNRRWMEERINENMNVCPSYFPVCRKMEMGALHLALTKWPSCQVVQGAHQITTAL